MFVKGAPDVRRMLEVRGCLAYVEWCTDWLLCAKSALAMELLQSCTKPRCMRWENVKCRGCLYLSPALARWYCFHPVCLWLCLFVCLFVSLSRCLSGRFNYEGLVPHKQYFAGTLLGVSSCASYVSRTHDAIDDVTRSQSRSNFESDISPSIFELERRSKAQNVGNAHGYLSGIFSFRYNFR